MLKKRERKLFDEAFHFDRLGNYKEAIRRYDTILELNEGDADVWNNKVSGSLDFVRTSLIC